DTLLRQLRQSATDPGARSDEVQVVGVDDWAFRRGRRYGTVLVDLERRCVLDLLADRKAETLAAWFRQHPGIRIISRYRDTNFAEGARQGAPSAVEVADRWHLLKNAAEALEAVLAGQHHALCQTAAGRQSAAWTRDAAAPTVATSSTQEPSPSP